METIYLCHTDAPQYISDEPVVMALGFFDGVHAGHQRLTQTARKIAKEKRMKLAVMTFYPHPSEVIQGLEPIKYLSPLSVKQKKFEKLGVEKLFVVKFDRIFSRLSPEEFIKQYIVGIKCKHVVAGFDFTYGYKGTGNAIKMKEEASGGKFDVSIVPKEERNGLKVSSTLIRRFISTGSVHVIPNYLGDYYEVMGKVEQEMIEREESLLYKISTNKKYILPETGVYQIEVESDNKRLQGICLKIDQCDEKNILTVKLLHYLENKKEEHIQIRWLKKIAADQSISNHVQEQTIFI
ncbi:FAD synthetase family protein [Domibacillus sp. DTU_2020_1001157_1_SI_ALB_TIR_016]|uniref:FAD synthetase family protein n=1 Tax=Domibacillus sp. DTU_2020_1001157_1_SI_ALB_TIR_016 TaxID=3077789 RepID=UPI0028EAFD1E|nr:FAD synthetase family protein [Domibacillus sp. DTU_2020_1001157_1_SI_ALB_TIR_016]WNS78017.1 FAD synthetase family protein [Domibacillus sp. DTU_2020_1001157_1_SI_ALB_TIR_016]